MKKWSAIFFFTVLLSLKNSTSYAQCSICARTTQQMGEKPSKGVNSGIIYLAAAPLLIAGFIGYRWWKSNRNPPTP